MLLEVYTELSDELRGRIGPSVVDASGQTIVDALGKRIVEAQGGGLRVVENRKEE